METYEFLIQKYQTKLNGWKAKLLFYAGKIILIKSVLDSIPSYHMPSILSQNPPANRLMGSREISGGGNKKEKACCT